VDASTYIHAARAAPAILAAALAALCLLGAAAAVAVSAPPVSTVLPEPVYDGLLARDGRAAVGVPRPGSGGWYWPIGTEDFSGWSGWLDRRGAYVHVAQDMPCAAGHAVYAIGDGVVYISRADAGGYGVGGAPGGCIIITHTTAAGTRFHALYGHVYGLRVKAGQRVTAGQVIARVNGCRHLHFSTHPGARYRDGNPYAGHVPRRWTDHGGFVDPVGFLKTNPRAAPYTPPELPSIDVVTETPPSQYGAVDGAAYWTEESATGRTVWRLDLFGGGEREQLAPGDVIPPFDLRRYQAVPLAAPALGFSVTDRRPVVTLMAKHDTPAWGAEAHLKATLLNAAGKPLQGGVLRLQRYRDTGWQNVALAVTDGRGAASLLRRASATVSFRVVFAPPATQPEGREYLLAYSAREVVTPHVALTTPRLPVRVAADALITVTGRLTPRHPAGQRTVQLEFQRRGAGGAWAVLQQAAAGNRDLSRGEATRYVGHVRLPKGSWRVRATHPADDEHALTSTSWRAFSVE
jgi:ribosomal protein L27